MALGLSGHSTTTVDLVHDTAPNSGDDVKVFPSMAAAIRYGFTPRLSLTVSDTFIRNDAPGAVDPFGLRQGRQTYDSNTLTVALDWVLERIATQAYYRNVLFINEGDNRSGNPGTGNLGSNNTNDTITHIIGLNGTSRIGTDYIVKAGYEFSRTDDLDSSRSNSNTGTGSETSSTPCSRLPHASSDCSRRRAVDLLLLPDRRQYEHLQRLSLRCLWPADGFLGVRVRRLQHFGQ